MAYERRYRTVVPIELGADVELGRWLARESFEKKAASDGLNIVDYSEREVPVDDIPPKVLEQLGRPLTDFTWFEFSGTGRLNQELFDWLSAECAWRNDQVREWLAAERVVRAKEKRAKLV